MILPPELQSSRHKTLKAACVLACASIGWTVAAARAQDTAIPSPSPQPVVLHAAHLLEIDTGRTVTPGEILIVGKRIVAVGSVPRPPGARVIELGDTTLLPGLIDVHVHLFLHPGAEDLQTVTESVPERTLRAVIAARDDLMGGFTAERDMGTEGAGSADTAVRNAIDAGLFPGPRLLISGNAIDILGGHEDTNHFNPEQHLLSNATRADSVDELVVAIRQQHKDGSDFVKIYETGKDELRDGVLHTPYQYTAAQLEVAVTEAARFGGSVAVHAMGEPGTLYAAQAGVASIDHATQLSSETMQIMKQKQIPAVPTFTVFEYFANEPGPQGEREKRFLDYKASEFKKQLAAGIPFAVGSDVGPFAHGTQARELGLMVKYGMQPLAVLQADMLNGAKLMGLSGQIGLLKPGYYADIVAVPDSPLKDITVVEYVSFVMKDGIVEKPLKEDPRDVR